MDVHVNVYARVCSVTFADVQKKKMCASGIVCENSYKISYGKLIENFCISVNLLIKGKRAGPYSF